MSFQRSSKRNPCPICEKDHGCLISENIVTCLRGDRNTTVPGWEYRKEAQGGMGGVFVRVDDSQTGFDREKWERQREAEREAERKRKANSLSEVERDRNARKILKQLGISARHKQNLRDRGLTDAQIEEIGFKSVERFQRLITPVSPDFPGVKADGLQLKISDGFLVPIFNEHGQIIGFQLAADKREYGKYKWLKSGASSHLPTGELPLTMRKVDGDPDVRLDEGPLKTVIASCRHNKSFIGASGGNFAGSPKLLKRYLDALKPERVIISPDAGWKNNHHVEGQISKTAQLVHDLGYEVYFEDWGQGYDKSRPDIDELDPCTERRIIRKKLTVQDAVNDLIKLGCPAIPAAPKQDARKSWIQRDGKEIFAHRVTRIEQYHNPENPKSVVVDGETVIVSEAFCRTDDDITTHHVKCPVKGDYAKLDEQLNPVSRFTGKNPSYLDKSGIPRIVRHSNYKDNPPQKDELKKWFSDPNTGLGTLSGHSGVVWIDIDIKNFKSQTDCNKAFENIRSKLPGKTWVERTGSGGYRIAFKPKQKPRFKNLALSEGGERVAEVLPEGKFVVLAPSIHPNGNAYQRLEWAKPIEIDSLESIGIYPAPEKNRTQPEDNPKDIRNFARYFVGYAEHPDGRATARCPHHNGTSLTSFSVNLSTGQFWSSCGCDTSDVYKSGRELAVSQGYELPDKNQEDVCNWKKSKKYTPTDWIDKEFFDFRLPEKGELLSIRDSLGGGKTTWLAKALKHFNAEGVGIVMIGYRNGLLIQTTRQKMPFIKHMLFDEALSEVSDPKSALALCIDSLLRFKPEDFEGKVIVFDEIMSTAMQLLGPWLVRKNIQEPIIKNFEECLIRASRVICLDGNMTDRVCDYLKEISGKKLIKVGNKRPNKPYDITMLNGVINEKDEHKPNNKSLYLELIHKQEGNIAITSSSQIHCETMDTMLSKWYNVLRVDSHTIGEPHVKEFLSNPDKYLIENFIEKEDNDSNWKPFCLIMSPSAESGVDITVRGFFEAHFHACFNLNTNAQQQLLFRIRDIEVPKFVFILEFMKNDENLYRSYSSRILEKITIEKLSMDIKDVLNGDYNLSEMVAKVENLKRDPHYKLEKYFKAIENYEYDNMRKCFTEQLKNAGHNIKELVGKDCKELRDDYDESKNITKENQSKNIYEAEDITEEQAKALKNNLAGGWENECKLTKYFIKKRLPGIEEDPIWGQPFVYMMKFGRPGIVASLEKRYYLYNPDKARLRQERYWQWVADKETHCHLSHYTSTHQVVQELIGLGFPELLEKLQNSGEPITNETPGLAKLHKSCKNRLTQIKLGRSPGKTPLTCFSKLCKLIGVDLKRHQKRVNGQKHDYYEFDNDFDEIKEVILSCIERRILDYENRQEINKMLKRSLDLTPSPQAPIQSENNKQLCSVSASKNEISINFDEQPSTSDTEVVPAVTSPPLNSIKKTERDVTPKEGSTSSSGSPQFKFKINDQVKTPEGEGKVLGRELKDGGRVYLLKLKNVMDWFAEIDLEPIPNCADSSEHNDPQSDENSDVLKKTDELCSTSDTEVVLAVTSPSLNSIKKSERDVTPNSGENRVYITKLSELDYWIDKLTEGKVIGIDTETTGLDPHTDKLRLIQISSPKNPTLLIDHFLIGFSVKLSQFLSNRAITKIAHNWKFDYKFLLKAGYTPKYKLWDTYLASELLSAGHKSKSNLKDLAYRHLGVDLDKGERLSDWSTPELSEEQLKYAALDAEVLIPLAKKLETKLVQASLTRTAKIEFDAVSAVAEIELNGMRLDSDKWEALVKQLEAKKANVEAKIHSQLKPDNNGQLCLFEGVHQVDLNSPKALLKALRSSGIDTNSTGKSALAPLADKYPILGLILEYREYEKALSSFGYRLPQAVNDSSGRIHSNYWQMGAASGRFSCSSPNLQQIPRSKQFRECFVPGKGNKFVIADYSQIELRIGAEMSGDEKMIKAYSEGRDLHRLTASMVLGKPESEITKAERQLAKATNFGLIYGQSAAGYKAYAEAAYGVKISLDEAEQFRENYFTAYAGIKAWHDRIKRMIYRNKEENIINTTRTIAGRRRLFLDPNEAYLNPLANTPVQGTGADILKLALGKLLDALEGTGAKIIGAVHDEIVLEAPEENAERAAEILQATMEQAGAEILKKVPVIAEASIGESWAEK